MDNGGVSAIGHVLILIVVEYGLGENIVLTYNKTQESLNPYCSGIWSRRRYRQKPCGVQAVRS